MKTITILILALHFTLAGMAKGGGFSPEQHALLDGIVDKALTGYRQDVAPMNSMLDCAAAAYAASGFDRDQASRQALESLRAQAKLIEEEIDKVGALIAAHRNESNNPAVMLLFLSREQNLGFHLYCWVRSVTEITDIADASVHRNDRQAGQLCTAMIQTAEADQELLSTSIQGLTGVLGPPPTP